MTISLIFVFFKKRIRVLILLFEKKLSCDWKMENDFLFFLKKSYFQKLYFTYFYLFLNIILKNNYINIKMWLKIKYYI